MAVIALLALLGSGGWVLAARPHRLASPAVTAASGGTGSGGTGSGGTGSGGVTPGVAASTGSAPSRLGSTGSLPSPAAVAGSSGAAAAIVVDVVGKVRRPGVYPLAAGARVDDAVAAAGGVLPGTDLTSVNLARKVADGEQVAVGIHQPQGEPAAAGTGAANGVTQPLDLNSATEAQLDALPGVGPVMAQRIVEWRTAHGGFKSLTDLNSVSGIGDAKYADLSPLVTVR